MNSFSCCNSHFEFEAEKSTWSVKGCGKEKVSHSETIHSSVTIRSLPPFLSHIGSGAVEMCFRSHAPFAIIANILIRLIPFFLFSSLALIFAYFHGIFFCSNKEHVWHQIDEVLVICMFVERVLRQWSYCVAHLRAHMRTLCTAFVCTSGTYLDMYMYCVARRLPLSRVFWFFTIAKNCNKFYGTYVAVKIIFITLFYLVGGRKNNILSGFECVIGYHYYFMCCHFGRSACASAFNLFLFFCVPHTAHIHTYAQRPDAQSEGKATQCIRTTSNTDRILCNE